MTRAGSSTQKILYGNAASLTSWGVETGIESVTGRHLLQLAPHLVPPFAVIARVVDAGRPFRDVLFDVFGGGSSWHDVSILPFEAGFVSVSRDVTEQHQARTTLEESEARLDKAFDATSDTMVIVAAVRDAQGIVVDETIVWANRAWRDLFSPEADPSGRSLIDVLPTEVERQARFRRAFDTTDTLTLDLWLPNAEPPRWLSLRVVAFGKDEVLGIGRDVTELRSAIDALRESEDRQRDVIEGVDAMVTMHDLSTGRWTVGIQAERMLGYPLSSLTEDAFWRPLVHPDDLARCAAVWDGASGHWDLEYRFRKADDSYVWLRERFRVQTDENGAAVRWFGVTLDVTDERRRRELVLRAQRLESLGRLAGAVAHDFQNVLFGISIMADHLEQDLPEGQSRDDARGIIRAAEQGSALTRRLNGLAHGVPYAPTPVALGDVLERIVPLLRRLIGGGIEVRTRIGPGLPLVVADPDQIEQVIVNLAINARDAMPDGGQLTISLSCVDLNETDAAGTGARPGRHVALEVADTGEGMSEEVLGHVFEPYFTTKPPSSGTGLGLAVVHAFVRAAGGGIVILSKPGEGTVVRMVLPEQRDPGLAEELTRVPQSSA